MCLQKNKSLSTSPTIGVLHPRNTDMDSVARVRQEQVDVLDQMNRVSHNRTFTGYRIRGLHSSDARLPADNAGKIS